MTISKQIPRRIKSVARSVGFAAWLDTFDGWNGLSLVLSARLTLEQRAAMAWAVLRSLPPDQIGSLLEAAFPNGNHAPSATFSDDPEDAALWAEIASPSERDAYCVACFLEMPTERRQAFIEFARKAGAQECPDKGEEPAPGTPTRAEVSAALVRASIACETQAFAAGAMG